MEEKSNLLPAYRYKLSLPLDTIYDFCRRHRVRKLSLFGSVLREDFTDRSDIDVLVEFEPDDTPGFLGLLAMQEELAQIMNRPVDLLTPGFLNWRIRENVIASAQVIYDAKG